MKKILKIFKKRLRYFDQNLFGKLTFPQKFLLNISGISASSPKVYTLGRKHQFSTTIFPISLGGGRSGVPPSDATDYSPIFLVFTYVVGYVHFDNNEFVT